ncbi:cyclin-dependent kinase regulatory subunit protein [Besnoitia besnoiti]|uniref:Cyclin-dependent kinases regulatory subunit n=1 Tax=Besnoitia besnoiti TaxID=94643 RepID=A0A2A9MP22_BESBE|nr:cyclin-dependent kinase regulatory subunit protein [Besnoitia besnoiti]PFH37520.1 cyclin-dependent kinase regulatory subunit protein [Besnoitia besnoiti]
MAGRQSLRSQLRALHQSVPEVFRNQDFLFQQETEDPDRVLERLEAVEELEKEQQRKYRAVFIPVDPHLEKEINCEILNTDIRNYPWKETPFGDVYYSPRYSDERYTYRHVILSRGVRKEAEKLASTMPDGLLTEDMFIHCLGIALSPGWTHFMCFNRKLKELILRRPREDDNPKARVSAKVDGAPGEGDEVDVDSDDDTQPGANPRRADRWKARARGICRNADENCVTATFHENATAGGRTDLDAEAQPSEDVSRHESCERDSHPEKPVPVSCPPCISQSATGRNLLPSSRRPQERNMDGSSSSDSRPSSSTDSANLGARTTCRPTNVFSPSKAQGREEENSEQCPTSSQDSQTVTIARVPTMYSSSVHSGVPVENKLGIDGARQKRERETDPPRRPSQDESRPKCQRAGNVAPL